MTNDTNHDRILVLGGTGKTGRRIVQRLTADGRPVRVGSRVGEPPFHWERPHTWAPVLDGVTAAYIAYAPDLAVPGAAETVEAFATQAVRAGVERLVLLSGRGEPEALSSEQAVQGAGAAWTVLRSSFFSQDFSESFLLDDVRAGVVALPVDPAVVEPFVDADDVAAVAVAALTGDRHAGQLYELTGPRALTFGEALDTIGAATGRELRFEPVSVAAYVEALAAYDVPQPTAQLLTYLFTEVLDGRNEKTADGVHRALGRPPADFAEYAVRAAATGVWAVRA